MEFSDDAILNAAATLAAARIAGGSVNLDGTFDPGEFLVEHLISVGSAVRVYETDVNDDAQARVDAAKKSSAG